MAEAGFQSDLILRNKEEQFGGGLRMRRGGEQERPGDGAGRHGAPVGREKIKQDDYSTNVLDRRVTFDPPIAAGFMRKWDRGCDEEKRRPGGRGLGGVRRPSPSEDCSSGCCQHRFAR